ncbi:hypothetical protein Tco_0429392, partial [Tanacetum coccineum]
MPFCLLVFCSKALRDSEQPPFVPGLTSDQLSQTLLVTYNNMKTSSEAEVPKPVVVPGIGGKRKGELGSLDTQHYGRGKRARE